MSEKTTINNDQTRVEPKGKATDNIGQNETCESEQRANTLQGKPQHKSKNAAGVAIGGLGVIAGVAGALGLQAFRDAPAIENPESDGSIAIPEPETLEEIEVAISPDDSMSFNEAFATAREEVGANGVFEWRGGVYGTYYAEEWENFSDEYKEEFSNHNWQSELPETDNAAGQSELEDNSFGNHEILFDENGNQYISLEDAITGEEVRISPQDLQYAVLDEQGGLIGVIGEEALTAIDGAEDGYLHLDEDGNVQEFITTEGNVVEILETDENGVAILNGPEDGDFIVPDIVGDDVAMIDDQQDGIIEMDDNIADYLADNNLPDYANDEYVDDFIA
jgi:hypothetical protein